MYLYSQATFERQLTITVTFSSDNDLDKAQATVAERVRDRLPRRAAEVQPPRLHHGKTRARHS